MEYGTSILLIAAGAVLRFAVTTTASGVSLQTVGVILMLAGALGLLLSFFWLAGVSRVAGVSRGSRDAVVREDVVRGPDFPLS